MSSFDKSRLVTNSGEINVEAASYSGPVPVIPVITREVGAKTGLASHPSNICHLLSFSATKVTHIEGSITPFGLPGHITSLRSYIRTICAPVHYPDRVPKTTQLLDRKPPVMAYSPYGPRPRRSNQLVILWVIAFFALLAMTWYLTTRHKETTSKLASELLHDGQSKEETVADAP